MKRPITLIITGLTQVGDIEAKSGRRLVFAVMVRDMPIVSTEEMFAVDGDEGAIAAAIQQEFSQAARKPGGRIVSLFPRARKSKKSLAILTKILFREHVNWQKYCPQAGHGRIAGG